MKQEESLKKSNGNIQEEENKPLEGKIVAPENESEAKKAGESANDKDSPLIVQCDKNKEVCTEEFAVDKFETKKYRRKGGVIERNYFKCPNCSTEYTAYCHSKETLKMIEKILTIDEDLKRLRAVKDSRNDSAIRKLVVKQSALKKECHEKMKELEFVLGESESKAAKKKKKK